MVMWVIAAASGRGFGTPLIQMIARAFLPIDAALNRCGIPRSRVTVASFFFLWILYALLITVILSAFILRSIPEPFWFVMSLGHGLQLLIRLFPGFFTIVIIAGALLSWVSPDPSNPVVQTIYGISEPLLAPFRRFVPLLGGLDISPIFAILAFQFLGRIALELVNSALRAFQ
jgi:YggT family protein